MLKLYYVTGYITHEGDPPFNGRQVREMIPEEAKDVSPEEVIQLQTAVTRCRALVEDLYRINPVMDAAAEYFETLSSLCSDNVEAILMADRRFRSYVLEFDMFLDYWASDIAHYKRIDGSTDDTLNADYKKLFQDLTHAAYDNHVEYQIMDLIRNQTAHVQSPVNRIHVGLGGNAAYASRDILLSKCKSGENKKQILKAQPEEIVLRPIVDVTRTCLQEIHDGLIDFQMDDLVAKELEVIGKFIQYAISKDHLFQPWLLMDPEKMEQKGIHHIDMKAYIDLMARLEKTGKG